MNNRKAIEVLGLVMFYIALTGFTMLMFTGTYQLTEDSVKSAILKPYHAEAILKVTETQNILNRQYNNVFSFVADLASNN